MIIIPFEAVCDIPTPPSFSTLKSFPTTSLTQLQQHHPSGCSSNTLSSHLKLPVTQGSCIALWVVHLSFAFTSELSLFSVTCSLHFLMFPRDRVSLLVYVSLCVPCSWNILHTVEI